MKTGRFFVDTIIVLFSSDDKERVMKLKYKLSLSAIGIIAATSALIIGILISLYGFKRIEKILLQEYDEHLIDLGRAVDRNLENMIDRCRYELDHEVTRTKVTEGQAYYLQSGDLSLLSDAINRNPERRSGVFTGYCIFQDGEQILCSQSTGEETLTLLNAVEQSGIAVLEGGNGKKYVTFVQESGGLSYMGLVDLDRFYQDIVVDSLQELFWVVLYNSENGLLLENHQVVTNYRSLTPEEMEAREDGFSIISLVQKAGTDMTDSYDYFEKKSGKTVSCRIAVLVDSGSRNQVFTIGVAADHDMITKPVGTVTIWLLTSAWLLAICIVTVMIVYLRLSGQFRETNRKLEETKEELDTQKQQAHAQRLELMGSMTASISHEFNNMLTPIIGYSLMILEKTAEEDPVGDYAAEIYQAAEKTKEMIDRLSSLTRKNTGESYTEVSAGDIAGKAVQIIQPSLPENITLKEKLSDEEIVLQGNETELLQVLVNLLLNAIQALSDKSGKGEIVIGTELSEGQAVFSVSDNGPGIKEEDITRIFEPFFTTKEGGKGTGLGLAISRQVAESHGGSLSVSSEYGKGARFKLVLPAANRT